LVSEFKEINVKKLGKLCVNDKVVWIN